jgi:hypothetical protein
MVTTSWPRVENMMELAREAGISWAWYFTTYEAATDPQQNFLTDPIWRKADVDTLQPLISLK